MGEILLFRPREGQLAKKRVASKAASGQIVFFTGVRYERMADPAPSFMDGGSGAPPAGGLGGGRRRRRG